MLRAVQGTSGSIGYGPTTAALMYDIMVPEARLLLNGRAYAPGEMDWSLAVTQANADNPDLFASATANAAQYGSALYGLNGTWPMPMLQYMYMYRNLTGYGLSGPLLQYFAIYLLGGGQALAADSGLTPIPTTIADTMTRQLREATLKTLTVAWSDEPDGTYSDVGSSLYTFSANRESYDLYAVHELQGAVQALSDQAAERGAAVVRVASGQGSAPLLQMLSADLQAMSSTPLRVLDETVNTVPYSFKFRSETPNTATHMYLNAGPMAADDWAQITQATSVTQIPVAIRPVALLYRGTPGLRISPCVMAQIIRRNITQWNDRALRDGNGGLGLPSRPIQLVSASYADAVAVANWIRTATDQGASCSQAAGLDAAWASGATYDAVVNALKQDQATPYTYLIIGPTTFLQSRQVSSWFDDAYLQAALLPSTTSGRYLTPLQSTNCNELPGLSCNGYVSQAYADAVDEKVRLASDPVAALGVPPTSGADGRPDATGNWAAFQISGGPKLQAQDVYPVFRLDFMLVRTDLTSYGVDGQAALAALRYLNTTDASARINTALGPHFIGLGAGAKRVLAGGWGRVAVDPSLPLWNVSRDSDTDAGYRGTSGLVLTRAADPSTFALPGTDAAAPTAYTRDQLMTLTRSTVNQYGTDKHKLDKAYDMAIAALVIGCTALVVGVVLSVMALAKIRSLDRPSSAHKDDIMLRDNMPKYTPQV